MCPNSSGDECFTTVPDLNSDMCMTSTRVRTHLPFKNYSTSSEMVQNRNCEQGGTL